MTRCVGRRRWRRSRRRRRRSPRVGGDRRRARQKYYDATKDLRAKFEQQLESPSRGAVEGVGRGAAQEAGQDALGLRQAGEEADGVGRATLWVYEPEDEQAYKQDLKGNALPAQVSFLLGEGKLDKEFDASMTKVEGLAADEIALKMVPRWERRRIAISCSSSTARSGQVRRTIIYGAGRLDQPLSFLDVAAEQGRRRRQIQVRAAGGHADHQAVSVTVRRRAARAIARRWRGC